MCRDTGYGRCAHGRESVRELQSALCAVWQEADSSYRRRTLSRQRYAERMKKQEQEVFGHRSSSEEEEDGGRGPERRRGVGAAAKKVADTLAQAEVSTRPKASSLGVSPLGWRLQRRSSSSSTASSPPPAADLAGPSAASPGPQHTRTRKPPPKMLQSMLDLELQSYKYTTTTNDDDGGDTGRNGDGGSEAAAPNAASPPTPPAAAVARCAGDEHRRPPRVPLAAKGEAAVRIIRPPGGRHDSDPESHATLGRRCEGQPSLARAPAATAAAHPPTA